MYTAIIAISCLLWIWFLGCTITWRFGRIYLVEGMGVKSIEFIMLVLYTLSMIAFILFPGVRQWILLSVLGLWLIAQFYSHWYFTIFGASKEKITGYNDCFEGTVKIFPVSNTRLIPDLYHIILHLLITADLLLVCVRIAA